MQALHPTGSQQMINVRAMSGRWVMRASTSASLTPDRATADDQCQDYEWPLGDES